MTKERDQIAQLDAGFLHGRCEQQDGRHRFDAKHLTCLSDNPDRIGECTIVSAVPGRQAPPELRRPHRRGRHQVGSSTQFLRCVDQVGSETIANPLPVSLHLARQMGGIKGRNVAADDKAVDDGGCHHQQTVADSQPPDLAALNMAQTPKQERRQTIHHFSSMLLAEEEETTSTRPTRWAVA
ncbi:hypothetical protein [Rhizobium laguerreae]|uniref:hypothetical protein n=1 Tax=Rhizobium laguerreae TaxID=1076926 RepID=UPI001FE30017|nr:hypothetical protein [Rhizobium laguerreae]